MSSPFEAITTVYSYYLPEVRGLIDRIVARFPHDVFLRSVTPGLDDFHSPVIDRLVNAHAADVPGLSGFKHRYPTSGSEEGIREVITQLAARGVRTIYMLRGDYEGYREVAKSRGIATVEVDATAKPSSVEPGWWFLSNPSARDGNVLPAGTVDAIAAAGHKIFYDLSYLGSTDPGVVFDISHPSIAYAAISFSKPYGLFYYRVGFTFAREEVPSLYANKWFKNVFSLIVADAILRELDLGALATRYKRAQAEIVGALNREHGMSLRASDAFLLAHLPVNEAAALAPEKREQIRKFLRADAYRFCLTPYFLKRES